MVNIENFLVPIDPNLPVEIHCIDDRGYEKSGQNIKGGGAAQYGFAYDTYAVRAINSNGMTGIDEPPVGEAAKVITLGLEPHGLIARLHHGCAAEAGVIEIANEIVTSGEEIYQEVDRVLAGGANESKFEQLQDFYRKICLGMAAFRGVAIEAAYMDSHNDYPPIERMHLVHQEHKATELIVNTRANTWYDAAKAYDADSPRYGYDLWAVEPIAEKIDAIIPHNSVEDFVLASVTRVIATSRLLPRGENETGVDIFVAA